MQNTAPGPVPAYSPAVVAKVSAQKKRERRFHIFLHIALIVYFFLTLLPFIWTE